MKLKIAGLLLALAWGSTMSVVMAHHSIPSSTKPAEVKGILRSVRFINPHSQFVLEAKGADGKPVMWSFETPPPAYFRAGGIKQSDFAKGLDHEVTVSALVLGDGTPRGYMTKMTFADGTSLAFQPGGG